MALSTPVLTERVLRMSPRLVETAVQAGSLRREAFAGGAARTYGEVLQSLAHARASSRLYREVVLREGLPVALGRYRGRRLTVPTRLVVGAGDPVSSPALLNGWQEQADDMVVEVLPDVGHFVPEEAPEAVAARARALFG